MARILRYAIVMAMGAGALGGPDALRLLLACAGRSPHVDILIAVFVIAAVTAPALGTMLLARFFRKPTAGAGAGGGGTGAAVDDPFAKMTLAVALAVAATLFVSLAAVCFLLVPCVVVGILDAPMQRLLAFAFKSTLTDVTVGVATVIGAMVIAFFFRKMPLLPRRRQWRSSTSTR
uniref:Uncharacterized protein n=1 Tax=Oryza punctata TaxID=4537 RepID=A0A0E0L915_ORYPU